MHANARLTHWARQELVRRIEAGTPIAHVAEAMNVSRATAQKWWGRYLVPTFHPAAALRGSARVLEEMRYDFGIVRAVIDGSLPGLDDAANEQVQVPPETSASDPEQLGLFQ